MHISSTALSVIYFNDDMTSLLQIIILFPYPYLSFLQDGKHGVQTTSHTRHTLEAAKAPWLLDLLPTAC